jgi:hypothetical protein
VKRIASVISAALVVAFFVSPLDAQILPPGTAFAITHEAHAQLDSVAWRSIATHTEQIVCIRQSALNDSLYIVAAVAPARHIVKTDSIHVFSDGPTCDDWQPTIHTHVMDNGWLEIPSPIDHHTSAARGIFGFLMSVHKDSTWTLHAYP